MNKIISPRIKVKEILKPVDAFGIIYFYRPDGTYYESKNAMVYLVKTEKRKTLGIKVNGIWYEAFTINGKNQVHII